MSVRRASPDNRAASFSTPPGNARQMAIYRGTGLRANIDAAFRAPLFQMLYNGAMSIIEPRHHLKQATRMLPFLNLNKAVLIFQMLGA